MSPDTDTPPEAELGTDGRKMAGSAEPNPEKCASRLTKPKSNWPPGTVRYCLLAKGQGTSHPGIGRCRYHLGSVRTHVRSAERVKVATTLKEISEQLGIPTPLRDPNIELLDLVSKTVQWMKILESKMSELSSLQVTDVSGQEHSREVIALWERAIDRAGEFLVKMTKLNLSERIIAIQEEHAKPLGDLLCSIRDDERVQLTDGQVESFNLVMQDKFPQYEPYLRMAGMPELPVLELEGEESDDL